MKGTRLYGLLAVLPAFVACSHDVEKPAEVSGAVPVQLEAVSTRAGEPARNDIYVKAFKGSTPNVYFEETLAGIPAGLDEVAVNPIVFPGARPYYPLGSDQIRIIAYSGKAPGGVMTLTAGTAVANDAILSNYGKRKSDTDVDRTYEPAGTIGTAADPVELLQFRHVMTQVIVDTVLDRNSMVDRPPKTLRFTLSGNSAVTTGRYGIRSATTETAIASTTAAYSIRLGTNYLVPTGTDLAGKQMSSLVIDDYTAKPADLTGYTIQPLDGETEMKLLPGYSYKLTLTISRLGLTGITLKKIDWEPHEATGNLTYEPRQLALNLGSYPGTGDDEISKVVLYGAGKQYVATASGGKAGFVKLPAAGTVTKVSLYTKLGLLLSSDIGADAYDGTNLQLNLSRGGLLPENPSQPYGAANPYLVTTPVQFINVRYDLQGYYKQAATVDLSTLYLIGEERFFNGFGAFGGTFDGNGYRVDGVDIEARGLFDLNSGTLKNIRLTSGTVDGTGKDYAGSIAGVNTGSIVACVNEARVTNAADAATVQGGIAGQNRGRIVGCVNTGTVLTGRTAGGICGENQNTDEGAIVACINTGMLNPAAGQLGFMIGLQSPDSPNTVIVSCFGLVGSAQHVIGSPELAVGAGNALTTGTAVTEPSILRNGMTGEMTESDRVVNRLNAALGSVTGVPAAADYKFVYDDPADPADPVTGITWPAPVMK